MESNGLALDYTLELGRDPEFDRMIAAVVEFAEGRVREGHSAGEIELELVAGRGVDGQIVVSSRPIIEAMHQHQVAKKGFSSWLRNRPETSMTIEITKYVAYYTGIAVVMGLFYFALQLKDLDLSLNILMAAAFAIAGGLAIPLRKVSDFALYLFFRLYWRLRTAHFRWRLGNIPGYLSIDSLRS